MTTDIWVALLAVAGVITQVVVTYLISRQSANDLRANIGRDIDIAGNLPSEDDATKLRNDIGAEIDALIARDEHREREGEILRSVVPIPLVVLVLWELALWREQGLPADLSGPVWVAFWFFIVLGVLIVGRSASEILRYILWRWRSSTRSLKKS
jgi:hypothetical protein